MRAATRWLRWEALSGVRFLIRVYACRALSVVTSRHVRDVTYRLNLVNAHVGPAVVGLYGRKLETLLELGNFLYEGENPSVSIGLLRSSRWEEEKERACVLGRASVS